MPACRFQTSRRTVWQLAKNCLPAAFKPTEELSDNWQRTACLQLSNQPKNCLTTGKELSACSFQTNRRTVWQLVKNCLPAAFKPTEELSYNWQRTACLQLSNQPKNCLTTGEELSACSFQTNRRTVWQQVKNCLLAAFKIAEELSDNW
jgi:uncharacterized protein with HEPN domain